MPVHNHVHGGVSMRKKSIRIQKAVNMKPYFHSNVIQPRASSRTFVSTNIAKIYNYPTPPTTPIVIGVISLGGGLYGTVTNNILTNGDVQAYWTSQGITNQPTVVIVPVGATNNAAGDPNSSIENTIDVEMIGSCCPGTNVTILFYIAPNSIAGFYNAFNAAINTPVVVNGQSIKPSVISCSWGAPESAFGSSTLTQYNTLFAQAATAGINICCASGDNGSSDGLPGLNVDFPSSSPNVVACGGTTLTCPSGVYDTTTIETTWSGSGGGVSKTFVSPKYQTNLQKTYRSSPDISLNADPNTGVSYIINGASMIVGGTSIVAPAIAAYIAAAGIKTFFNTILYSLKPASFHDVVSGSNGSYSATIGYDNTTGLGSLNGLECTTQVKNWISASSLTMNTTNPSILVGQSAQMLCSVLPANATNPSVVWKSSNTAVATVNSLGVVTGVKVGTATITATTNDGWFVSSTVASILAAPAVSVTGVSLTPTTATVNVGKTYSSFVVGFTPTNATNKSVTWSSNNTAVATVSSTGVVTGVAGGTATITVQSVDGAKTATALVTVTVPVTAITLSLRLSISQSVTLQTIVTPSNATNPSIVWSSSVPTVASVSAQGVVVGVLAGTTTITATSGTVTASWPIVVS